MTSWARGPYGGPTYTCTVEKKDLEWLVTIQVGIRVLAPLNLVGAELLGQKGPVEVLRRASSDTELALPGKIHHGGRHTLCRHLR